MISLTVTPDDSETRRYDREVSELQSDVNVGTDYVTGKLNYVTNYSGFSDNSELQEGHFLSLKIGMTAEDTDGSDISEQYEYGIEVVGSEYGPTITTDDYAVFRVKNNNQKLKVFARKVDAPQEGNVAEVVLSTRNLDLLPKPQDT